MGKTILLVEDDRDWSRMATAALKEAGYGVTPVSGAGEALLQDDLIGLSLIVLDLDLGGENGLMLMKHLKRHHPATPILVYTGIELDERATQQMRDAGALRFLRKGALSELVAVVQEMVGEP